MKGIQSSMLTIALIMVFSGTQLFAQGAENSVLTPIGEDYYAVSVFYPSGELMESGFMLNGESTGKWLRYNESGVVVAEANYINGMKDGVWYIYSNAGDLQYELVYENNVRVMAKSFGVEGEMVSYRVK